MPTQLQFRRGTTAQNNAFTGAAGEISVDETIDTIRVHDGTTAGGHEITQNAATQTLTNKTLTSPTISAPTITGNATGVNLTLSGDLTVNGTTTTVASTNTVISDNLIELNNGAASNANDSGIVIERGSTGDNAFMGWDESADKFIVGTTTATGASTGDLTITSGTLVAATFEGNLTGNVTGDVTGDLTGDVTGNVTGNVTGDLTGDVTGNVTGNADTATTLATGRTISLTGDVTGTSGSFDGSANLSFATDIANSGVTAGTYGSSTAIPVITVAADGRITSATTSGITVGNGTLTLAVSGTGLSGSQTFTANQSGNATFTVTSNATSANTASTIVARDGSGNFTAGVITATATAARYADLAERYAADADYEPGTVVCLGGEAEVTQSIKALDKKIIGIVSTAPAHIMNSELEGGVAVALTGRVPCKVIGAVSKGDMLVSSSTPGHAMAWNEEGDPPYGSVIGKSIEDKDSSDAGVVEVAVGIK